jgi:hypothetical protein
MPEEFRKDPLMIANKIYQDNKESSGATHRALFHK